MTGRDPVADIARAVLYEGYVLWPYRRTALKNRKRWTFGCVHPRAWTLRHPDDPCEMRAEILAQSAPRAPAVVRVCVRFLQVVRRRLARYDDSGVRYVDEIEVDGARHVAWDEAVEREVTLPPLPLASGSVASTAIDVPSGTARAWLFDDGFAAAAVVRSSRRLAGAVEATAIEVREGLHRVRIVVSNDRACGT